jgi:hypothetical protein
VGERLVVEMAARGASWIRLTVSTFHGVPRVDLAWQIDKSASSGKEAAFLAFPFASPGGSPR